MAKALVKQQERLVSRKAQARDIDTNGKRHNNPRALGALNSGARKLPGSMNAKKGTGTRRKQR